MTWRATHRAAPTLWSCPSRLCDPKSPSPSSPKLAVLGGKNTSRPRIPTTPRKPALVYAASTMRYTLGSLYWLPATASSQIGQHARQRNPPTLTVKKSLLEIEVPLVLLRRQNNVQVKAISPTS